MGPIEFLTWVGVVAGTCGAAGFLGGCWFMDRRRPRRQAHTYYIARPHPALLPLPNVNVRLAAPYKLEATAEAFDRSRLDPDMKRRLMLIGGAQHEAWERYKAETAREAWKLGDVPGGPSGEGA